MNMPAKKFLPAKYKTYAAAVAWLALCAVMFSYAFGILDSSNRRIVSQITEQQKSLTALQAERDSYIKAQADVAKMKSLSIQPQDFFNKDITLVKEIETLENWSKLLGVTLNLSGLSGTIKTAPKVKSLTEIFSLPYSISLSGPYTQVVNFLEVLEHLPFITNISNLNLSGATGDAVNASFAASFYLKN